MAGERGASRGGCWKIAGAGCGCLVIVVVVVIALLLMNVGRIQSAVEGVRESFGEMMDVRAALQDEFGAQEIHIGYRTGSAQEGATLSITLVDPPLDEIPGSDLEEKARHVAAFTKGVLVAPGEWSAIGVTIRRPFKPGAVVSTTTEFSFDVDELPDGGAPSAEPDDGPHPSASSRARPPRG